MAISFISVEEVGCVDDKKEKDKKKEARDEESSEESSKDSGEGEQ